MATEENGKQTDQNGRGSNGKFTKGNQAAKGRRSARAAQRKAFSEAVSPAQLVEIARSLVEMALSGDVSAAKLVLAYVLGPPQVDEGAEPQAITVQFVRPEPRPEDKGDAL